MQRKGMFVYYIYASAYYRILTCMQYGVVERVYIDRHGAGPAKVFVKFTSQLSGLRAVNALEGRIFNGNTISALFYDTEKFEQGIYD